MSTTIPDLLSSAWREGVSETASDSPIAPLVDRARGGCHEAYAELVRLYHARVFRFCLAWTGSVPDAEEICQDAFVRAYSALPRFAGEDRFHAWLLCIARNLCRDHHRRTSRRERRHFRWLLDRPDEEKTEAAPDVRISENEQLDALRAGIAALPLRLREVIVLCGIEGLAQEECARILGCSRRAVEGRLYRARRELAERCGLNLT